VLQELGCVLESPEFHGSHRAQTLLRCLVENALSCRSDRLKERTIGIELFHRDATYDTGRDGIVRVAASDVRKRLTNYYSRAASTRSGPNLRIVLPSGSYVPQFERDERVPGVEEEAPEQAPLAVIGALSVACAILGVQNWRLYSNASSKPYLGIVPWSGHRGSAGGSLLAASLELYLATNNLDGHSGCARLPQGEVSPIRPGAVPLNIRPKPELLGI
jgi:hypothetical protein